MRVSLSEQGQKGVCVLLLLTLGLRKVFWKRVSTSQLCCWDLRQRRGISFTAGWSSVEGIPVRPAPGVAILYGNPQREEESGRKGSQGWKIQPSLPWQAQPKGPSFT